MTRLRALLAGAGVSPFPLDYDTLPGSAYQPEVHKRIALLDRLLQEAFDESSQARYPV